MGKRKRKRRVLSVIRHINKVIRKEGVYNCVVAEIYDSSLRKITKSAPAWYDTTWHDDRILALRFLRSKGYVVSVQQQWANGPSYFKGEMFYMNMTGISISKQ
ncbi:MAG: hypothetical protein J6Q39_07850 [Bacteroidales bacterium]|nr:hypothetical protein [Bacteroidales bacterium]